MSTAYDGPTSQPLPAGPDAPASGAAAILTPEPLMRLGFGFWGSKVLMSAVELGVFKALTGGPLSGEALGERLGLHPRGTRDFLDALVSLGLLDREAGRYSNAPLAREFLDPARPAYVGGMAMLCNDHLYQDWGGLTAALRTGLPRRRAIEADTDYAEIYPVAEHAATFAQAMTGASLALGQALAGRLAWRRYRTFLDVGCAQGGVTVQIALAHAHLTGLGLDLPPVRPVFEEYVASFGLEDRLRFQTGDVFRDPLPDADVVVIGHMLHGLDLDGKRMLIAKAYEALPSGGMVVVFDMMIDDERRSNTLGLLMSLNMLIETAGGFDYTGAECLAWLGEAGFHETRIEPLPGPQSMAIGIK